MIDIILSIVLLLIFIGMFFYYLAKDAIDYNKLPVETWHGKVICKNEFDNFWTEVLPFDNYYVTILLDTGFEQILETDSHTYVLVERGFTGTFHIKGETLVGFDKD